MTYRKLLEAITEAKRRSIALSDHDGKYPKPRRGHNSPDLSLVDAWDAEHRCLERQLNEEIIWSTTRSQPMTTEVRLAIALLQIASAAMPDSYLSTDSRCCLARHILLTNGYDPEEVHLLTIDQP